MTRYDIYDNELHPGNTICWCTKNRINCGRIASISEKGVIRVSVWNPEKQLFSIIPQQLKAWSIVKIIGIPAKYRHHEPMDVILS